MMTDSHQVTWLDVALVTDWMIYRGLDTLETVSAITPAFGIFHLRNGASILGMLNATSQMEASDLRDRIYALLGLYSMWLSCDGSIRLSIKPDYRKTVVGVYCDVVRNLISLPRRHDLGEGPLRVMLRNEWEPLTDNDDGFPSWIPRWDKTLLVWKGLTNPKCVNLWAPSGDSAITMSMHHDSKVLLLRGFKFTTITSLERGFQSRASSLRDTTLVQATLKVVIGATSKYIDAAVLNRAFAVTLTAGETKMKGEAVPYDKEDIGAYLVNGPQREEALRFASAILNRRTFFITESGHMGMGSRYMQIGHEICVCLAERFCLF
jgi:hypothetical protein